MRKFLFWQVKAIFELVQYLDYLNRLVDECNNDRHHFLGSKPIDTDYSYLTKKIETNAKARKFEIGGRVRITKYKNIFSKGYTENWSKKYF